MLQRDLPQGIWHSEPDRCDLPVFAPAARNIECSSSEPEVPNLALLDSIISLAKGAGFENFATAFTGECCDLNRSATCVPKLAHWERAGVRGCKPSSPVPPHPNPHMR
jgi:hypothetical protein